MLGDPGGAYNNIYTNLSIWTKFFARTFSFRLKYAITSFESLCLCEYATFDSSTKFVILIWPILAQYTILCTLKTSEI